MAIWMMASALFPIVFFGMIIKAVIHYRRLHAPIPYPALPPEARRKAPQARDWVPSP